MTPEARAALIAETLRLVNLARVAADADPIAEFPRGRCHSFDANPLALALRPCGAHEVSASLIGCDTEQAAQLLADSLGSSVANIYPTYVEMPRPLIDFAQALWDREYPELEEEAA